MNITNTEITKQYNRIKKSGWLVFFEAASKRHSLTVPHLLAIASRETNLRNIRGDFRGGRYHGFGVMQVDIGTDPAYARAWSSANVEPSIRRGAEILASKMSDTRACVGKRVKVRSKTFTGKAADNEDVRRIGTAAYNCGRWAHFHFSFAENVDSTTTGKDYSRDVYDRALVFAQLYEKDGHEGALKTEVRLQGKYATADARRIAAVMTDAPIVKLKHAESQESSEALERVTYHDEEADRESLDADEEEIAVDETEAPVVEQEGAPAPPEPAKRDEAVIGGRPSDPVVTVPSVFDRITQVGEKARPYIESGIGTTGKYSVGAILLTAATAIYRALTSNVGLAFVGIAAGIALVIFIFWLWTRYATNVENMRLTGEREKRAHELKMKALELDTANANRLADPTRYNVVVGASVDDERADHV